METTLRAPTSRKAHRAGPIEVDEQGRETQRCLRCDLLLYMARKDGRDPIPVGRRVFLDWALCPGGLGMLDKALTDE